jgi:hypothetical protein
MTRVRFQADADLSRAIVAHRVTTSSFCLVTSGDRVMKWGDRMVTSGCCQVERNKVVCSGVRISLTLREATMYRRCGTATRILSSEQVVELVKQLPVEQRAEVLSRLINSRK